MNTDHIKQAYNDLIRARSQLHRHTHNQYGEHYNPVTCYECRRLAEIENAQSTEYREVVKEWLG